MTHVVTQPAADPWTVVQGLASVAAVVVTVAAIVAALCIANTDRRRADQWQQRQRHVDLLLQLQRLITDGLEPVANPFEREALVRGVIAALPDSTNLRAMRQTYIKPGPGGSISPDKDDMVWLYRQPSINNAADFMAPDYLHGELATEIRRVAGQ